MVRCLSNHTQHTVLTTHAGALVSTCQVQLALAGTLLMVLIGALLHPNFWEFVGEHFWWPVSVVIIIFWHIISQALLNKYVVDGTRIKRPFLWLFAYVGLSAAYCMVRILSPETSFLCLHF